MQVLAMYLYTSTKFQVTDLCQHNSLYSVSSDVHMINNRIHWKRVERVLGAGGTATIILDVRTEKATSNHKSIGVWKCSH